MQPDRIKAIKDKLLIRLGLDEAALKAQLKFKAVIIFCSTLHVSSTIQIICDLASSRDGSLLGVKRKPSDPQVVDIIMTNPDLVYADKWPLSRYGPQAMTIMT